MKETRKLVLELGEQYLTAFYEHKSAIASPIGGEQREQGWEGNSQRVEMTKVQ